MLTKQKAAVAKCSPAPLNGQKEQEVGNHPELLHQLLHRASVMFSPMNHPNPFEYQNMWTILELLSLGPSSVNQVLLHSEQDLTE